MSFKWNNTKLLKNILLISIILLGIIIRISGRSIFIIFLGMEIKMFGIIPFILLNKEDKSKMVNTSIYYFLVQVFGRLTFLWGNIIKFYLIGVLGLCLKMGISPFFWWVPSIFKRLDWFSIIIIGTIQKVPSFIILRILFDITRILGLFICISGLIISILGINYNNKDLKVLMGWSSVGNMSLIYYLLVVNIEAAYSYFICYILCFIIISHLLLKNSVKVIKNLRNSSIKSDLIITIRSGILILAGMPPLLGFQWKLFLFRGLNDSEVLYMIQQIMSLGVKDYMIEFPLCQDMIGWKVSLIIRILLVIQIISYIKIFINMYTSYSRRLEGSSRFKRNKLNLDIYMILLVIIRVLILRI